MQNQAEEAGGPRCGCVTCDVPAKATPGRTQLQVESDLPGQALRFTVPETALPGDRLLLQKNESGRWTIKVLVKEDLRRELRLPYLPSEPEAAFARLADAARALGAYISPKLTRRAVPPSNVAGIFATEQIEVGEELVRMPEKLVLSASACAEVMPELFSAVQATSGLFQRRRSESAHAACLATLLRDAKDFLGRVEPPSRPFGARVGVLNFWSLYAQVLHGECFDNHPHMRAFRDLPSVRSSLEPSKEGEWAGEMVGDVMSVYRSICKDVDAAILGRDFEASFFLQARLCLLTRTFQTGRGSAMVPVSDFLNHGADPGVLHEWDDQRRMHIITADRPLAPGEEVVTSYGQRSNVLLFRTYGFTLPPEVEPCWSYIIQSVKPREIYDRFLPPEQADLTIQLDTWDLEDSLVVALNACLLRGTDAAEFLRSLCRYGLEPLEKDEALLPALLALGRAREVDPGSAAWWEYLPSGDSVHSKRSLVFGADWAESVLRVKMSEYLCLTAHVEAVDVFAGRAQEDACLVGGAHLRSVLLVGLDALSRGKQFSMSVDEAC